ncbi:Transcriptional regulator, AraC family [Pseudomonas chlororaphis subsp. piscium]|uniref:AraC family transcriptional regulator n=1 Tax=Pseudomonas chlororaphis TaxID=587753 RepID=UPI000F56F6B8|nr:AraC family transcriptional regulator [Pseudomonas chlororaphis]AZC76050.1 Transcriptional regulator, AraC family [Pseudomonas chlororaphis subsp. piscium]
MTINPFIRALSLAGFDKFAARQGLDPTHMLRCASLPPASLRRPEDILSFRRYCELLELCQQSSSNALFGLEYGLYQGIDVFGDIFYLIHNTRTVGDALFELRTHYGFYNGAAQIGLDVVDGMALLSYRAGEQAVPGLPQAEELACGVGLRLMRTLAGGDWQPKAVLLRHPPLGDESAYRRALGITPTFAAAHTGLLFDASVLALPLSLADETLHQLMAEHLSGMERLAADEMPGYVRQLLRNLLPSGRATIERVADCMAIKPRTLQRRLAQEGTSFQRLLDETRQGMVHNYLKIPSISMTHVAQLLGYADVSTFSRAFNRWFGMSPLECQKQLGLRRQPFLLQSRLNDRQSRL